MHAKSSTLFSSSPIFFFLWPDFEPLGSSVLTKSKAKPRQKKLTKVIWPQKVRGGDLKKIGDDLNIIEKFACIVR